jgi:Dyp-type peroxidase family
VVASHAGADLLDGPLVLRDLRTGDTASRMLALLQPNIIHPHVRSHLRLLALRVQAPAEARHVLAEVARGMKSAAQQHDELRAYRASGAAGTAFVSIGLSAGGYERLGIERAHRPRSEAFDAGLQHRDLGDPAPSTWEPAYRDGIDVLVVVGSHHDEVTDRKVREVLGAFAGSLEVVADETGCSLTNSRGDGIEHFGYVDGRSQPLFIDEELEAERRTGDGLVRWNPLVPLSHVLVADPGVPGDHHAFGSYLVYRKLEQNVQAFKRQEQRLAEELGLVGDDAERAGALLIGRFEDGTPLTLAANEGMPPIPNDFTYDDDPGTRCPLGAHIRVVNARVADPADRTVIARRGQGYGVRGDDPEDGDIASKPSGGVGLLFMAVVAGLERQFESLQRAANGDDGGPPDAVMGQRRDGAGRGQLDLSTGWNDPCARRVRVSVDPVVTLRGGEYCFLPSLAFLRGLDG